MKLKRAAGRAEVKEGTLLIIAGMQAALFNFKIQIIRVNLTNYSTHPCSVHHQTGEGRNPRTRVCHCTLMMVDTTGVCAVISK